MSVGVIAPGQWLGLVGGGQLGRMFTHAAQAMGYRVCVLDPQPGCPAGLAADEQIIAAYDDERALEALAARCRAVTTEFENVPAESLERLAQAVRVTPSAACVSIAQDRMREKAFARSSALEVAPYLEIRSARDLDQADESLFPGILKAARLGYDGKGQSRVADRASALRAFTEMGAVACVLEKQMPLAGEVSVIVARGLDGCSEAFPVFANEHRGGILAVSSMPAPIDEALAARARAGALALAQAMNYIGVLCVEFFLLADGTLLVNEMAPRPHNSGHATIDACRTSQFEQQVRVMCGLPLGQGWAQCPAVLVNLLGDIWFDARGEAIEPDWAALLALPGVKLHLYAKEQARPGRKMGHVTVLGETLGEALGVADRVQTLLGIVR